MPVTQKFDYQKATQAINYLARKYKDHRIHRLMVVKLLWAADRYHLRKYGRMVTGDTYLAMKLGPVGSGIKDIASEASWSPEVKEYGKLFLHKPSDVETQSIRDVDTDVFSDSDIESLEFAFENLGKFDRFDLSNDFTHLYPEWVKFKEPIESKTISQAPIDPADFFLDPSEAGEDPFSIDSELLEYNKEKFLRI